jgi:hypothetical protein
MKTQEIQLNYLELSFITGINSKQAKFIFEQELSLEKISSKQLLEVKVLEKHFKTVRCFDNRFDGQNELIFCLEHKSENYKKYLSNKAVIKNKKFTGGKSIFYKICSPKQLEHAKACIDASFKYLYPKSKKL